MPFARARLLPTHKGLDMLSVSLHLDGLCVALRVELKIYLWSFGRGGGNIRKGKQSQISVPSLSGMIQMLCLLLPFFNICEQAAASVLLHVFKYQSESCHRLGALIMYHSVYVILCVPRLAL